MTYYILCILGLLIKVRKSLKSNQNNLIKTLKAIKLNQNYSDKNTKNNKIKTKLFL